MTDPADPARRLVVQPPPRLPDVDSPPAEDLLDGVPSKEVVVEDAQSSDEIVDAQPSVDELLDPDR